MVRYRFISFNVFIFISFFGYNQQTDTDIKLANSYFQDGDFEKSVMYFEKLEQEPSLLPKIYHYYRSALMELGRYKNVEKLSKSYLKYFPERLSIYVDLGELYKYLENDKKSESFEDTFCKAVIHGQSFEKQHVHDPLVKSFPKKKNNKSEYNNINNFSYLVLIIFQQSIK